MKTSWVEKMPNWFQWICKKFGWKPEIIVKPPDNKPDEKPACGCGTEWIKDSDGSVHEQAGTVGGRGDVRVRMNQRDNTCTYITDWVEAGHHVTFPNGKIHGECFDHPEKPGVRCHYCGWRHGSGDSLNATNDVVVGGGTLRVDYEGRNKE